MDVLWLLLQAVEWDKYTLKFENEALTLEYEILYPRAGLDPEPLRNLQALMGEDPVATFERDRRELLKEERTRPWSHSRSSAVVSESPRHICISVTTADDCGGAHPNSWTRNLVVDKRTGAPLTPVQAFADQPRVIELIKTKLPGSLEDYWVNAIRPMNFALTSEGIRFTYSPYDIACYAMGFVEVTIPFEEIRPLLTPAFRELAGLDQTPR